MVLAAYGNPAEGRTRYVTLRRIDCPTALDARQVDLGPAAKDGGRASATLSFTPAADGSDELATLAIELSPTDALALDDAAQVVVPPPRRMPVVLASLGVGGAAWLAKALKADPEVALHADRARAAQRDGGRGVVVDCRERLLPAGPAPGGGDIRP